MAYRKKKVTTMKPLNSKILTYKQPLQHKVIEAQKPERINQKQIFDSFQKSKTKKIKKSKKKY